MRVPFIEFIGGGDPKFMIALTAILVLTIVQFFKKLKAAKGDSIELKVIQAINQRMNNLANWLLVLSVFSLLLGFMHSFYTVAKAGGIATPILFQGLVHVLITPVYGIAVYSIAKLLAQFGNPKVISTQ